MFIFDSDHLSILQFQDGQEFEKLLSKIKQNSDADFYVTIISFHEQVNGWAAFVKKSRTSSDVVRAYEKFELLISNFANAQVLPFSHKAAEISEVWSSSFW